MDPFHNLLTLEKFGIKFGLANIATLAAALGNPQTHFKSILIAGTNGKGSVTAMVDCALRASGLKVGRYTSPHLVSPRRALRGRREPVSSAVLAALVDEMRALIDDLLAKGSLESPPTFFEVTTAIAFEIFRRADVDVAVLEVGLGGRLDSTNIVQPIAAAITSIDFDHEQYLGNTLAAIAAEKLASSGATCPSSSVRCRPRRVTSSYRCASCQGPCSLKLTWALMSSRRARGAAHQPGLPRRPATTGG